MKARSKRNKIVKRDGPFCFYCNRVLKMPTQDVMNIEKWAERGVYYATVDHLIPRREGGTHDIDNLVLACSICHRKRHEREARDG